MIKVNVRKFAQRILGALFICSVFINPIVGVLFVPLGIVLLLSKKNWVK